MSLNMNSVSDLTITEGDVRTIHDADDNLLWGKLSYDTTYQGDTTQQTYSGKNLFDPSAATNNKLLIWTTGNYNDNTGSVVSDYISVAENTKIQLTYLAAVFFYDSSKNLIGHFGLNQQIVTTSGGGYYNSFTVPSGYSIAYIRLNLKASQGTNPSNLVGLDTMINTGDTLFPYEPYVGGTASPNPDYPQTVNVVTSEQTVTLTDGINSQTYTVDLGSTELCKIGDYQDYIYKSGDDWYEHKECEKIVLDGSVDESWNVANSTGSTNCIYCYTAILDNLSESVERQDFARCTHFTNAGKGITSGITDNKSEFNIGISTSRLRFLVRKEIATDQSSWESWLSNNEPVVYYALETPTDTQITDATLIEQLNAINQFLTRYGYNSSVTGNLPMIINQTALS